MDTKPVVSRIPDVMKSEQVQWTGPGPFAGHVLKTDVAPTVYVYAVDSPIQMQGSVDGVTWLPLRDADGQAIRLTQAGVYQMPCAPRMIRPASTGQIDVVILVRQA
jgi:hypothetical protein